VQVTQTLADHKGHKAIKSV